MLRVFAYASVVFEGGAFMCASREKWAKVRKLLK